MSSVHSNYLLTRSLLKLQNLIYPAEWSQFLLRLSLKKAFCKSVYGIQKHLIKKTYKFIG